ncbi:hypothetical protein D3C73_475510 [compost metagenome]
MCDQTSYFILDDIMQHFLDILQKLRCFYVFLCEILHRFIVDQVDGILAGMFLGNFHSFDQADLRISAYLCVHFAIYRVQLHCHLFFAGSGNQFLNHSYDLADFIMSEHDSFQHNIFRHFIGFSFHHHDGVLGSGYDYINIADRLLRNVRINDEFTVNSAHSHTTDRSVKRHIGNAERSGGTNHSGNIRRTILIHAHYQIQYLHIVAESFRKQRANWTVSQTAGQNRFLTGSALTFDETSRNFANCI